jgi:hypothetical protein
MPIVEVNGQEIEFPDDMDQAQIKDVLRQKFPPQNPQFDTKEGLGDRIKQDYGRNLEKMQNIASSYVSDDISAPEAYGRMALKYAQIGPQSVGQAMASGFNVLPDFITSPIKKGASSAYTAAKNLPSMGGGTIGERIPQELDYLEKEHPRLYGNLEAGLDAGNLLAAVTPIKGKSAPATALAPVGKGAEALGSAIYKSGEEAFNKRRRNFLQDLITPKETPTVRAELFSRSKESGFLRSRVVEPTSQENAIMKTLSALPVTKNKSLAANYNVIKDANLKEADALIERLGASKTIIPDIEINSAFQSVLNDLSRSPYLTTGGAEEAVKRVISIAQDIIKQNPKTPAGLLKARKAFDAEVARYKKNVFDPAISSPVTDAVQSIRQAMNGIVAKSAPYADVRSSLLRQSNMYRAMDAIETKGGWEGKNIISRAIDKGAELMPVKSGIAKIGLAGGLAGGAALAPAIALGAGGAYLTGKAITSPALRKGVGRALMGAGKATTMDLRDILKLSPADAKAVLNNMEPQKIKLLASPDKIPSIPMSESEIAIAQAKMTRGKGPNVTHSGPAVKTPVSQALKIKNMSRAKQRDYEILSRMFMDGDLSQNKFVQEAIRAFGLTATQARDLAKEIKTYK